VRYSVAGEALIQILNFKKHQTPHNTEKPSTLPAYVEIIQSNQSGESLTVKSPLSDGEIPEALPPDSLIPLTLIPDSLNTETLNPLLPVAPKNATTKKTDETETALQAACRQTWQSYSDAYFNRYGTEPVRNVTVNTQIKNFVKRIGAEESPHVAAFFVQSNAAFYVQRGHTFGNLLADAEKVRTEWATGRSMTSTRARQIDQSEANSSVVGDAMKILEGMGHAKTS
jgi:hypothetical protein